MSEILRLRIARAPQRRLNGNVLLAQGPGKPGHDVAAAGAPAARALKLAKVPFNLNVESSQTLIPAICVTYGSGLIEFDIWLRSFDDLADPKDATKEATKCFKSTLDTLIATQLWIDDRAAIIDALTRSVQMPQSASAAARGILTRFFLIIGLVELLAEKPTPLQEAGDLESVLRYRTVALPPDLLDAVPRKARLARRYGFADLYTVRSEWHQYEAGEIAHIESIMAGETKERSMMRLDETKTSTTSETETTTTEERDSQTTDRLELQDHTQTQTDLAAHIDGKVDTEGTYGATKVQTHLGGSLDYSQKNANDHAVTHAKESVSRAVKRIEQRVKLSRSTQNLQRTIERDRHTLDNAGKPNLSAIYRWVDKVERLQVYRYRHRFLVEFHIPEPAAYLIWRRSLPKVVFTATLPEPLVVQETMRGSGPLHKGTTTIERPLQPKDITEQNYQLWVAKYYVSGVEPPPALTSVNTCAVVRSVESKEADGNLEDLLIDHKGFAFQIIDDGGISEAIPTPDGYRLKEWSAEIFAYGTWFHDAPPTQQERVIQLEPSVSVMIGGQASKLLPAVGSPENYDSQLNGNVDPFPPNALFISGYLLESPTILLTDIEMTGPVQVSVSCFGVRGYRGHILLRYERLPSLLQVWQQRTYEAITAAYWALKKQYDDEVAARAVGAGIVIDGESPARNQQVVVEELKRGVIEMLMGEQFDGLDDMQDATKPSDRPRVSLDSAIADSAEVQFVEQAFEWENLSYILYPYYWAGGKRWGELADISGADPDFDRFLRSGAARVIVPARPNFEDQVHMYVDFGVLWGGGPVPTVNDPEYLSIADEIRSVQCVPKDGEMGESWEVRLPTTLVWLDNDSTMPKVNDAGTLDKPPGKVLGP